MLVLYIFFVISSAGVFGNYLPQNLADQTFFYFFKTYMITWLLVFLAWTGVLYLHCYVPTSQWLNWRLNVVNINKIDGRKYKSKTQVVINWIYPSILLSQSYFPKQSLNTSLHYTFLAPSSLISSYSLTSRFPADVFISDNSGPMQSAADVPASRYKLIEGNQRLSIPLACICLRPACLQHSWLLETSHSSIELLSPLLLPSW